jgi:hypothetical protein
MMGRRVPERYQLTGHPQREYTAAYLRPWARRWPLTLAGAVLLIAGLAAVIALAPRLVLEWDLGGRPSPADRAGAVNDIRNGLLQGLAGLGLVVGAVFTWRQLQVTRQGQAAERFTAAVTQVGDANLDVRLGGIYALELIARNSSADQQTVTDLLSAYVVRHGGTTEDQRRQWPAARQVDDTQLRRCAGDPPAEPLSSAAPDVHAAIRILARRRPRPREVLHLSRSGIAGARLQFARLAYADMHSSDLRSADLTGADLRAADLAKSNVSYANFDHADLADIDLRSVLAFQARFEGTDLRRADLARADLSQALMRDARLDRADLRGARLTGADLTGADLTGAFCDDATIWPDGYDWHAAGAHIDPTAPPPRPTSWLENPYS